jgi:hypothetical protein
MYGSISAIMAATDVCSGSCSSLVDKTSGEQEGNYLCYKELRLELQKVKTKILSYEEIIKVLQEELCKKELLNKIESSEQNDYSGDSFKVQSIKDD